MKNLKLYVFTILILITNTTIFAQVKIYVPSNQQVTFDRLASDKTNSSDFDMVLRKYVPEKYLGAFMYYTEGKSDNDTLNLRIQILALGSLETGWKPLVSRANKNGSVDKGYLQLNSYNINDDWFMYRFGPNEKDLYKYNINDEEELYLITCINFYKALRKLYGDDAAYCYNCGETRYRRGQIPKASYNYKKNMATYVTKIISEINDIKEKRIELEKKSFKTFDVSVKYVFSNNQYMTRYTITNNVTKNTVTYEIIKKNDTDDIYQILKRYTRPNKKYTFVGYIKKTGAIAPVFMNNKTKVLVVC